MTLIAVGRRVVRPTPHEMAPGVHLLEVGRGVTASNVYLVRSGAAWVLIDAGWAGDAAAIKAAAESLFGPGSRPAAVLVTHLHPDHSGSAGELARAWGVPVYVHPDELPMAAGRYLPQYGMPLDRWVVVPLMSLLPAARRERIRAAGDITDVVRPLDPAGRVPGLTDWEWIPAPGHSPGHVAYLRRSDGVLLSGDAVLTVDLNSVTGAVLGRRRLAGPPRYTTWDWPGSQRSAAALADLGPRVLGPGHGRPITEGTATALQVFARRAAVGHAGRRFRLPLADPGTGRYRRPPHWYSRMQWLGHALTFLGLSPRYVVTLEVPGRRSGVIRRTNLVRAEHEGDAYLVSLTGESEWVRNVRAAGGRVVLSRRGRRRPATLVELPAAERAPVIRSYVLRAGRRPGSKVVKREARTYFEVGPGLDLGEIGAVADRWPVFRVVPEAVRRPGARPLLGVRRRPGRLAAAFFRLPLMAFQHDAGPAMGRTFVAFTHVGRRTGQSHRTVAMVLRYDEATGEVAICAAWGPQTDWYRNLRAHPAVQVQLGGRTFVPEQRFLGEDEAYDVARQFRREHPHRLSLFSAVLGWADLRDDAALRELVRAHPFVAFRPADPAP